MTPYPLFCLDSWPISFIFFSMRLTLLPSHRIHNPWWGLLLRYCFLTLSSFFKILIKEIVNPRHSLMLGSSSASQFCRENSIKVSPLFILSMLMGIFLTNHKFFIFFSLYIIKGSWPRPSRSISLHNDVSCLLWFLRFQPGNQRLKFYM